MELEMMAASARRGMEGMITTAVKTTAVKAATMKATGMKPAAAMKASAAMEAAPATMETTTPATMETTTAAAMATTAAATSGRLRRVTEHDSSEHESDGCDREDRGERH
jgi:hypothetical protein